MMEDDNDTRRPGAFSSPPCFAPDYFDPLKVDAEQARDVARWRRAERSRLRAERQAISVAERAAASEALSRRTKGRRRSVVAVARKLAVILHRLRLDGTQFRRTDEEKLA